MNPAQQVLPLTETVTPADQTELAEAVRRACESGTPLYPVGGGTSVHYGVRPTSAGWGLWLAGLNRVIDYPARDLTITVEAGLTMAELAGRLASEGQRLPVDVPRADQATLGGVVATNPSGPRRYGYGTIRDYVIGIRAVDGRGTAFSAGGRVVKNAAGYDLCRLLTGSLGTLGVITQVSLMVKPMPEASALVVGGMEDFDAAERLLAKLVHTQTLPAAIELLLGPAWHEAFGDRPDAATGLGWLAVGFEGTAAEVDWMLECLEAEWRQVAGPSPRAIRGEECARCWQRLIEFPAESSEAADGAPLVVQIGVLPSAVVDFSRRVLRLDPDCSLRAQAGDGVIQARLSAEPEQMAGLLRERLRPPVEAASGSLVVLSHPEDLRLGQDDVWGPPADGAEVMQAIKSRFDPKGILNPSRFVYRSP